MAKSQTRVEFGDFQTPPALAKEVCNILWERGIAPASIIEPTCGLGALLFAGIDGFPSVRHAVGVELNPTHLAHAHLSIGKRSERTQIRLLHDDFYQADWRQIVAEAPSPLLVLGNPPWVTNSTLGSFDSHNLPKKSNASGLLGLEALTGKSNFDISEAMLLRLSDLLATRGGTLAMLCKTSVARRVLLYCWKQKLPMADAALFAIDSKAHFNAAVDACLFVTTFGAGSPTLSADVFDSLCDKRPASRIGYMHGQLIADMIRYDRWRGLERVENANDFTWRSGIKHDCASVMELIEQDDRLVNGKGEAVAIEAACLYPMMKGSEVAKETFVTPRRWMLVPQQSVGSETSVLSSIAPKTWAYLLAHADLLDARRSSIYRNRPRFSVFGVGDYTFQPWKVAIAGLYKTLSFRSIGPHQQRPVVFDDTVYLLACKTREQADLLATLLNSSAAREFYSSFIFWDNKRPITVDILQRLDLCRAAQELGLREELTKTFPLLRRAALQRLF